MAGPRLLDRTPRPEPWAFTIYSAQVCRALVRIRKEHAAQQAALNPAERCELAEALQVLALAAHLESQLAALPEVRDD